MTRSVNLLDWYDARTLLWSVLAACFALALCSCRAEYSVRREGVSRQARNRGAYQTLPAEAYTGGLASTATISGDALSGGAGSGGAGSGGAGSGNAGPGGRGPGGGGPGGGGPGGAQFGRAVAVGGAAADDAHGAAELASEEGTASVIRSPIGPWRPPGLPAPWPEDEYICDGGDAGFPAGVTRDWEIHGLEAEDTIAHYDTLDGKTIVEPSNRVCIYAPRFGSVRAVRSLVAHEMAQQAGDVYAPVKLTQHDDRTPSRTAKQHYQPIGHLASRPAVIARSRQGDGVLSEAVGPRGFSDAMKPYENLAIIREGVVEMSEMAWLALAVEAANTWTHNQAVQVILDHQAATAVVSSDKLHLLFTVKSPTPQPRLRIVKVASKAQAAPGEEIDFTLRFDNVGNQPIGNVTIIDNLSPRLEYVPQSAQCSREAQFSTQPNEGDSLVLRWELTDPLRPGEGGIIRFRCRLR